MTSSEYDYETFNSENLTYDFKLKIQGSEAKVYEGKFLGKDAILKERFIKKYRHSELDKTLTAERIRAEVRALNRCFEIGVKCPAIYFADLKTRCIVLEKIPNSLTVKEILKSQFEEHGVSSITSLEPLARKIGAGIAKMHKNELVHGDLTTSNLLLRKEQVQEIISGKEFEVFFIDFGLSKRDIVVEDKAVDLYVLERAISSSHPNSEQFYDFIVDSYTKFLGDQASVIIIDKLSEVRQRGRKRTMAG